jgi:hypothetical protein
MGAVSLTEPFTDLVAKVNFIADREQVAVLLQQAEKLS